MDSIVSLLIISIIYLSSTNYMQITRKSNTELDIWAISNTAKLYRSSYIASTNKWTAVIIPLPQSHHHPSNPLHLHRIIPITNSSPVGIPRRLPHPLKTLRNLRFLEKRLHNGTFPSLLLIFYLNLPLQNAFPPHRVLTLSNHMDNQRKWLDQRSCHFFFQWWRIERNRYTCVGN